MLYVDGAGYIQRAREDDLTRLLRLMDALQDLAAMLRREGEYAIAARLERLTEGR